MKLFLSLLAGTFILTFALPASAQVEKYTISVEPFKNDSSSKKYDQYVVECRNAAMRYLLACGRFSVLERDATQDLEAERNLQKSESFIDGKVVQQGKAIGAEFVLTGSLSTHDGQLSLLIFRVSDGKQVEGGVCDLKESWLARSYGYNAQYLIKKINASMQEITGRWLAQDRYTVVRELDGDASRTDRMLVAAGSARGIREGYQLEIYYTTNEDVDGVSYQRDILLGLLKVDVVENANFSQARVKEGKKEIKKALNEGKKLYCRIKLKQ